jgi:hypothetical protein
MNIKEKLDQNTSLKAKSFWNSKERSYYNKDYQDKESIIDKCLNVIASCSTTSIELLWKQIEELKLIECFDVSALLLFNHIAKNSYSHTMKVDNQPIYFYGSLSEPLKVYSLFLKLEKQYPHFTFLKNNLDVVKKSCQKSVNSDSVSEYITLNKKGLLDTIPNLFKHIQGENLSFSKKGLNIAIAVLVHTQDVKILDSIAKLYSFVRKNDPTLTNVKINILEKELEKGESIYPKEKLDMLNKLLHDQTIFQDIEKTFSVCIDIEKVTLIRKENTQYHYRTSGASFILQMSQIIEKAKAMDIFLFKDYVNPKELLDKISFMSKGKASGDSLQAEIVRRFEFIYQDEKDLEAKKEAIKSFLTAACKLPTDSKDSVYLDLMKDISFKFQLEQKIAEPVKNEAVLQKKRSKI